MVLNITSIATSSNGIWEGDDPLNFAFPLLIVQTTLIIVISRLLAYLFKPLRQPKVIAEIMGGIILGPSVLGRSETYMRNIFPSWSTPILGSVASIGLLFFLFLVGLELDLNSIRRSGRRAVLIASAGISLPFICGFGIAVLFRKVIAGADKVGYSQLLVFMGVSLSITAFPVLARILAELKLLTTRIGEVAMAAAAINDVVAWILLALAIALTGSGASHKSPIITIWILLCGLGYVAVIFLFVRPVMRWVASKCPSEQDVLDEVYIVLTLCGVLVSGFCTDFIGIHSIFGAFVFGLVIPKDGNFARRLIERIEDFVTGLLLPLYFASSGLNTNVGTIKGGKSWALLVLVIATACVGKITGTFVVSMLCKIPAREALTLGFLMNTKGLVELIVLNIGLEKKVLNDEMFAILVLMALVTTFITTPTVMALYKPARGILENTKRKLQRDQSKDEGVSVAGGSTSSPKEEELRLLACAHGPGNVTGFISLIESTRSCTKSKLRVYIMHMVELTERTSSIIMAQRLRRNGLPFFGRKSDRGEVHDRVTAAFKTYGQLGRVNVRPVTVISALPTMHEDICHAAEQKRVSLIILPFHKMWRSGDDGEQIMENVGHGWRVVNQRVMKHAPCSVAVLVDRGLGNNVNEKVAGDLMKRICMAFFGGPDDREALELVSRMVDHPGVNVTVIRFMEREGVVGSNVSLTPSPEKSVESNYTFSVAIMNRQEERALDETALADLRRRLNGMIDYKEKVVEGNIMEDVLAIGRSGEYQLIVVGKGRFPSTMVAGLADQQAEHAELGPVGDILTSSNSGVVSSVLIVQQHDLTHTEETPVSKVVHQEDAHEIYDQV
ncbi:Cation/H(+) antiporter 20-like protein [Drosera capensis]